MVEQGTHKPLVSSSTLLLATQERPVFEPGVPAFTSLPMATRWRLCTPIR